MTRSATLATRNVPTTRSALKLASETRSDDCRADCQSIPTDAEACITVDMLGGLRVRAGQVIMGPRDLGGTKLRRVLLALLMHRGSPVSKDRLVSLLWEGAPPSGAKATLESYVCVLRKKLQPCHSARSSLITTVAGCYAIDMTRVDLDLDRYERLISAALRPETSPADALPMLKQAMILAELPLLPEELDCEWLDDLRTTHSRHVHKSLISAANKVADLSPGSAQKWARLALDGDSLDESAWHALLASMEASGQHADGLRAYDHCRRLFAAELGCAPGPRLQELYVRLLRGANEDDAELSQLFDAVVRLHAESQLSERPEMTPLMSERREAKDQADAVAQACRALDLLLHRVGGRRKHLEVVIGAS